MVSRPKSTVALLVALATALLMVTAMGTARAADTWTQVGSGGLQTHFNQMQVKITSSVEYNDGTRTNVFVGTANSQGGCQVWRHDGLGAWTQVNTSGFGDLNNTEVSAMAVCSHGGPANYLYAGTANHATGCEVWRYDGTGWARADAAGIGAGGFGDANNNRAASMAEYLGLLYVGTDNVSATGAQVWTTDGSGGIPCTWVQDTPPGLNPNNITVSSMMIFPTTNTLHIGTENLVNGCEIWDTSGPGAWTRQDPGGGWGTPGNFRASSICVYNHSLTTFLYVGTWNQATGCEIWRTAGAGGNPYADWTRVDLAAPVLGGFGNPNNEDAVSMASYGGFLVVGTTNMTGGCEIWRTAGAGGPPYTDWAVSAPKGFGTIYSQEASTMVVPTGGATMYCGTLNMLVGGGVWQETGGWVWAQVNWSGFSYNNNRKVTAMADFNGDLYVGTECPTSGCKVFRYDNPGWTQVNMDGFGGLHNLSVSSMAEFGGKLYAGVENWVSGCEVWRYDGPNPTDWTQVGNNGFGDASNVRASSMAVFNHHLTNYLCVGTENNITGAELWQWDGTNPWNQVNADGFGDGNNSDIDSLYLYNSELYAGTENVVTGTELWQWDGTNPWGQVNADGFGDFKNRSATVMIEEGGYLFVGAENATVGCGIWRTHGLGGVPFADWVQVNADGFGEAENHVPASIEVFDSALYVGTENKNDGGDIYRSAMLGGPPYTDWSQVNDDGFGDANNEEVSSLLTFGSKLYAGTENDDTGCQVWKVTGPSISSCNPASGIQGETLDVVVTGTNTHFINGVSAADFGSGIAVNSVTVTDQKHATVNVSISESAATGGRDVEITTGAETPAELAGGFAVNSAVPAITSISPSLGGAGTDLTITGTNFGAARGSGGETGGAASYVSFGDTRATEYLSWSNTEINCRVPEMTPGTVGVTVTTGFGTSNSKDFTVTSPTWYLAEGSTAWGFDCYVSIENPNDTSVKADITYMTENGEVDAGEITLPALSQTTVNPRNVVGDADFSTKVECTEGKTIAADRTMSWTGQGAPSPDGHCSVGVTAPARTWYLPEGSSDWGFECWLLIQNPNGTEATATVTYMIEGSGPQQFTKKIPANSRRTYNMADDIGAADASMKVEADIPVIPERAMYRNNRREGHDSIGTTTPADSYYLAEGTTAWGFTTYVLVQNPQDTATDVTVTYMTPEGPVEQPAFNMPANSRKTIRVNDVLPNSDLSTQVTGSQPVIAERAMYWGEGTPLGEACHDSVGMASPHTTFYLPDGQTVGGYETWTLVQNPNDTEVTVDITYMTPDGQGNVVKTETIPASSRKTFGMLEQSGMNGRASILVTSRSSDKKIMVERAMYWNSRGAGTDTIGGFGE